MSVVSTQGLSITIQVNESGSKDDKDDQCMKAAVASFEILNSQSPAAHLGCPEAVFHLRDLAAINVRYVGKDGKAVNCQDDKSVTITACAVNSILKHLDKAGCVGKDGISFQARDREKNLASGIFFISLKDIRNLPLNSIFESMKEGIFSHSYAYLSERRLCLFFKEENPEILKKVQEVLANIFPTTTSSESQEKKEK